MSLLWRRRFSVGGFRLREPVQVLLRRDDFLLAEVVVVVVGLNEVLARAAHSDEDESERDKGDEAVEEAHEADVDDDVEGGVAKFSCNCCCCCCCG